MRLKQYLTELSAKNVQVEVIQADNKAFVTYIKTNPELRYKKHTFEFHARKIKGWWEIYFEDERGNTEQVVRDSKTALEVFAGVEKSFKIFIKKYNPSIFEFSSFVNERSRRKLYELLARRIEKKVYDYKTFKVGNEFYWVFYKDKESTNIPNKADLLARTNTFLFDD